MNKDSKLSEPLQIDTTVGDIRSLKRWARFLGIAGITVSIFLVIVSIFGGSILRNLEDASLNGGRSSDAFMIILLSLAAIIFFLSVSLMLFSKSILPGRSLACTKNTMRYLRNFFMAAGVFTITSVLLFILQLTFRLF